ncbi:hypothetical protein K0040_19465 [Terrisporobacter petrolearius]|uniref:hypothetical protein n=1 Tax=Terrisporobacter petrolearius TaxID=1460447 RepID=UPI001D162E8D|nr:hypothetical protein [Terrisporobacter petrolearius]MCC3866419.1 hypothetical protein [Terrisporobacter petrolearius]
MNLFTENFKKYLIIMPIYTVYIIVFELILGCSFGDIWDDLLDKYGVKKYERIKK